MEPDYAQMALYHIGRAYHTTGQRPLAQDALKKSIAIDPASEIAETAESLLKVSPEGREVNKRWWLQTEIGYEYNDNLTVEQADIVSDEADHAAVFEFGGGLKVLEQPINGEITYDFYQSLYSEFDQFNMQSHRTGISAGHDFENLDFSLDYDYTYIFIDADEFMGTQSLMPAIGLSLDDLYTNVSYTWQSKKFLDAEDEHRDAQNHSGGVDFFLTSLKKIGMINIGVQYEYEDAEDNELDYTGPVVSGSLRLAAPWGITIRPSYKYHMKKYDNMIVDMDEEREDIKQTLGLTVKKKLRWSGFLSHFPEKN
ncbi:MAG: DUF560 domain-containing protein, partial [Candidatus Electrothrix sp. AR4]|nr:DUF560 domain-containing protein [Candidatus Electrothrix sp. AR4]